MSTKREWVKILPNKNFEPYSSFTCPICGFGMAWRERNMTAHKKYHNHILDIIDQYGFYLDYESREQLKLASYEMMEKAKTLDEKKFAYQLEWFSRYMRSLDVYGDIDKHPSFNDYISMILHKTIVDKDEWDIRRYGKDLINSLVYDFGTLNDIPYGSYYRDDYTNLPKASFVDHYSTNERPSHNRPDEKHIVGWVYDWLISNKN